MKLCQRICAVATALIFCLNFVFPGDTIFVKAEENELTKDYIVCTKNKEKIQKIEKKFKKSKEINNNAEDCLEKREVVLRVRRSIWKKHNNMFMNHKMVKRKNL